VLFDGNFIKFDQAKRKRKEGRAGGISMSLDFFGTFWVKPKSADKNYDPVIARFFSPNNYVQVHLV